MQTDKAKLKDYEKLVNKIAPMFAGKAAEIQGAALADLLAIWIAGHIVPGDPAETQALRERLLTSHIELVRRLINVNANAIHGEPLDWGE